VKIKEEMKLLATTLSLFFAVVTLSAGGNSKPDLATQQMPSHMQSTEGRLDSAQGVIRAKSGLYYLAPTKATSGWFSLDKQSYAKKFAGQTVKVYGFFNYDSKSITVVSFKVMASSGTKGINEQTKLRIQK
jgi:hypothetical protein